jgi:glycosyltransferase involved in cell wall biosynthesis
MPAAFCGYPPRHFLSRLIWAPATIVERGIGALRSHFYDVTLIQRELISTLPTFELICNRPRVFDVDDAIWIHRNGIAARRIADWSDRIICGNRFVAEWFSQGGRDVRIIPTAVDIQRFRPTAIDTNHRQRDRPALGWSGTGSGLSTLYEIEDALATVLQLHPEWMLVVMSDESPRFRRISPERVVFHTWSEERELEVFQSMDIGLMPLREDIWSRGKCSYKMLIYMACGLPVVVSAIGMNIEVLNQGACGAGVRGGGDWVDALDSLMRDEDARRLAGACGRKIVEDHYTLTALAPRLAEVLANW